MKLTPVIFAFTALFVQASCTTSPHAGDIVSEKVVHFAGKRFVQQRIVLTTDPYETELRSIQIR
ncbi:hypothetical protein [Verrucomicrobium sp. BvORR106]|uniref:hypothetical protein n=1 Tax=Verrucomicrobium sp. BvORR106 TaxID=1403819 RepID=UPI000571D043|nr:hypothetical protein [Verrucomicrobium sp. BvORR106]